jgi:site-specific DNA recombinase
MKDRPSSIRCAIYTRKSTEEGLEQEFNSLDAQRESAELYIGSQRVAGWMALAERYDDGGFSGASMDRPALRRLLADVEARKLDCVVVYKVDRLSRSLLDFSRLIELFDRYGVSFVSVTQEFNTTTSLGRLTLNILLSFAQFEREIIGERTRDKMGAARRKGKWIGGSPVLGYDVDPQGGRLVVNELEADRVRRIFEIAAKASSLNTTLKSIQAIELQTKAWTSKNGRYRPSRPFTTASLRLLLSNRLYTGAVSYKGAVYAGEQPPIVEEQLWEQVNARLDFKATHRPRRSRSRQDAPLAGLLYCNGCREPMVPTYTTKAGQRYRYYACATGRRSKRQGCGQWPIAAVDIEVSVTRQLEPVLGYQLSTPFIQKSVDRITYQESTRAVRINLQDGTWFEYTLAEPVRSGVRHTTDVDTGRVPRISRVMALAIRIESLVREGVVKNYRDLADLGQISPARLSQIVRLADLTPSIQEELLFLPRILRGTDPVCEKDLRELARCPEWDTQRKKFDVLLRSRFPNN